MKYVEAIEFLYGLRLFGAKFGLENTRKLAALAGNPQNHLHFIHVAGTNGKGSTCAMLEAIYRAAGLRTGLFTSPHLVSFRERLQINRQLITEEEVVELVEEIIPLLKDFPAGHHPTFFEVVTVMALRHFARNHCELVIWETGLGGRLDATNIVTPLASLITNIALDHTQWLGDTLARIAAEKAGIIKPGVPILTTTDEPEALAVIQQVARTHRAPFRHIGPSARVGADTPLPALPGEHQRRNAALALATIQVLHPIVPVPPEAIRTGLAGVAWPGRLQTLELSGNRCLLLDGAHNPAGVATLCAALQNRPRNDRPALIFGALEDKKWPEICHLLAPLSDRIHVVPVASERSANPRELADAFRAARPDARVLAWPDLRSALIACQEETCTIVTGSLYLVGEALELAGHSPAGTGERGLNDWTWSLADK